jgi:predicted nucleic acid-binding protein
LNPATQFVLAEIADSLAAVKFRRQAAQVIRTLETNDLVEIVPAASELFAVSLNFYENRQDKKWGFTDCSS